MHPNASLMLEDHQAPKSTHLCLLDAYKLPYVLQPVPVQRNLIVNLVRLVGDTVKMIILTGDLMAHGGADFVDLCGAAMQYLPGKR